MQLQLSPLKWLVATALSVLALLLGLAADKPVHAGVPGSVLQSCNTFPYEWCDWDLKVSFPSSSNTILVIYTVRVGHYVGNIPVVTASLEQDISADCVQVGGPIDITGGMAHFPGNGYYKCKRPSFAETVTELTNGLVQLADFCYCKSPAAAFNGQLAPIPGRYPLLYRQDGQFYVTVDDQASITTLQAAAPNNSLLSYNSRPWFNLENIRLWSGTLDDGMVHFTHIHFPSGWFGFLQNPPVNSAPDFVTAAVNFKEKESFLHWSEGNGPTYEPIQGLVELATGAIPFYIGYDPVTGEIFQGQIENLWDDPGCYRKG